MKSFPWFLWINNNTPKKFTCLLKIIFLSDCRRCYGDKVWQRKLKRMKMKDYVLLNVPLNDDENDPLMCSRHSVSQHRVDKIL